MGLKSKIEDGELEIEPVEYEVESLGGETVHILPLTQGDEEEIEDLEAEATDPDSDIRQSSVIRGVVGEHLVDEDGEPEFDLADEEDAELFEQIEAEAVKELYLAIKSPFFRRQSKSEDAKGN